VQDVVADTFLAAWRRYGELRGEPLPWLLGIARRSAANHRRSGARQAALRERLQTEPPASGQTPAAHSHLNDRDPRVATALAGLGERDREALMLVAWDGLEHRVAASAMGCSTGAFTVRVHRARRKLERALASEESNPIEVTQEARSLR
jgi:RNA polymerase sigma-70 factor (ECF subfamily)